MQAKLSVSDDYNLIMERGGDLSFGGVNNFGGYSIKGDFKNS